MASEGGRVEEAFRIVNKPRMRRVADMAGQQSVRAYRKTPSEVCLQIRMESTFANAVLTLAEAKELARRITAAVDKFEDLSAAKVAAA